MRQPVNPVERGHIAFRTDDIEAFKRRLEERGIAYADYGAWAMSGWHQIFFHDPEGNVIEVHQVREAEPRGAWQRSVNLFLTWLRMVEQARPRLQEIGGGGRRSSSWDRALRV